MRLLLICNEYPPSPHGGIGTFVYTLAQQLETNGHKVHVIGFDRSVIQNTKISEHGITVKRLSSPFFNRWYLKWGQYVVAREILERLYLSQQVKIYCKQNKIDLIESYDWNGPLWFHPGRPLVVRMHGAHSAHAFYEGRPSPRFLTYIEKKNLRMGDVLIGVSQHISELTLRATKLEDRNFDVIYNGVDTSIFRPLDEIKSSENEVLFAGTVVRRKGIYELFAAIPLVLDSVPSACFTIVGRLPTDKKKRQALINELLESIPFSKREAIVFADVRPYREMPEWYNRATCAVFPSLAEAYGLTCAEAMACGTPVVMTSRASGPEIIENGVTGFLCEPTDTQALAEAIITSLTNPIQSKTIASNAMLKIKQDFDISKNLQYNLSLYERLVRYGQK